MIVYANEKVFFYDVNKNCIITALKILVTIKTFDYMTFYRNECPNLNVILYQIHSFYKLEA